MAGGVVEAAVVVLEWREVAEVAEVGEVAEASGVAASNMAGLEVAR